MVLRLVVLALTLANLGFYVWSAGWLDGALGAKSVGDREPQRMEHQVRPEALVLSRAASGIIAAPLQPVAPLPAPPQLRCIESGPYRKEDLPAVEASLRAALAPGAWVDVPVERAGVWMVFMGRFIDEDARLRKEGELKRRNATFERVDSPAEFARGLSLGRFDSKAGADSALAELNRRGVVTARVVTVSPPATLHMLRVEKADPTVVDRLKGVGLAMPPVACAVK